MSSTRSLKLHNSNCLFEKFQRLKSSIVTFTKYCCDTLKAQNNSYRSRAIKTRNKRHKQNLQQGEIWPQLRWHHKVSQVIYRDREVTDDIYWTGVALPLLETIKLHSFCATFVLVMDYRHTFTIKVCAQLQVLEVTSEYAFPFIYTSDLSPLAKISKPNIAQAVSVKLTPNGYHKKLQTLLLKTWL